MKILLTGSNGFLGNYILKYLRQNHELFTLNRSKSFYNIDLTDENFDFNNSFDCVIHCSGLAHFIPKTTIENQSFFYINFIGTKNLLNGLEKYQLPKRFVFISTVAVYGRGNGINIKEEETLLAKDPYGLSKLKAEQIVLDWCHKNNVTCTILRLPLLVGVDPPGNLATMIKGIQKKYYFNIAGGQARKSMVLAEDVAKILIKASEIGGIYNLTDGYHPSFYELSNVIGKHFQNSIIFNLPFFIAKSIALLGDVIGPAFPIDSNKLRKITSDLTFDDNKARQFLGWNPTKILDYYKK